MNYSTNSNGDTGFLWNGVWHSMSSQNEGGQDGGDDAPPTGVREPRRPRTPLAPAAAAIEPTLDTAYDLIGA